MLVQAPELGIPSLYLEAIEGMLHTAFPEGSFRCPALLSRPLQDLCSLDYSWCNFERLN